MGSIVYWQQAETELRTGRPAQSVVTHRHCVDQALKSDFREGLKWMLVSYGCALVANDQFDLGCRALARVLKWRDDESRKLTGDEVEITEPAKEKLREALGPTFEQVWIVGQRTDLDALVEELLRL